MLYPKAIDFDSGKALVVTDLHGEGEVYAEVRELFLRLRQERLVDRLIICGDLIHGYGSEADDASLEMLQDVMHLQQRFGAESVVMLMGNHEMPHVYGVPLGKGSMIFTPRFERSLAKLEKLFATSRSSVIEFLKSLPFCVRTKAGVMITHSGATPAVQSRADAENLLKYDHDYVITQGDALVSEYDIEGLRSHAEYHLQAMQYLAVESTDDPRYTDYLRGQLLSTYSGQFSFLWDVLFARNEQDSGLREYEQVLQNYLRAMSQTCRYDQRILVAGHIGVRGGYEFITEYQLRLASYSHANPHDEGHVLVLDCETPVQEASQLVPFLRPTLGY